MKLLMSLLLVSVFSVTINTVSAASNSEEVDCCGTNSSDPNVSHGTEAGIIECEESNSNDVERSNNSKYNLAKSDDTKVPGASGN